MSSDQRVAELERQVAWLRSRMEPPLAGEFTDTASSPADDLYVVTADWDDRENTFGPVRWSPIGNVLPQAGDEAVILERSDGVWQVVAWWSDSQEAGAAQSAIDALDTRVDALEVPHYSTGSSTATWTAASTSANVTIAHGLGVAPGHISLTSRNDNIEYREVSKDSTNIVVRGYHTPGTAPGALTLSFGWAAFK